MMTHRNSSGGQSLAETVLLLPLLLILLAGGYWVFRTLELEGSAESAAHSHMLRTGRSLTSIHSQLSRTILPDDNSIRILGGNASMAGQLPLFRGVSGRTETSVAVTCKLEPAGGFIDLPAHDVRRDAEGAVDCWGKHTRSGTTIRRTVLGIVASGAFR